MIYFYEIKLNSLLGGFSDCLIGSNELAGFSGEGAVFCLANGCIGFAPKFNQLYIN